MLQEKLLENFSLYKNDIAIIKGEENLTYGDLEELVGLCSYPILDHSDSDKILNIGVLGRKSFSVCIGELMAVMLGKNFVPLNTKIPVSRLLTVCKLVRIDVFLCDNNSIDYLDEIITGLSYKPKLILFPEYSGEIDIKNSSIITKNNLISKTDTSLVPYSSDNAIAYTMFTSGSTGTPKGVPVSIGNLEAFIKYNISQNDFNQSDKFTQFFESSFDLSVFDIFMPLSLGATICIPSNDLDIISPQAFLEQYGITVWFSSPSAIAALKDLNIMESAALPSLRVSLFCGEALHESLVEYWYSIAPNCKIKNLYGPTELTIACASYTCNKLRIDNKNGIVSIGKIYDNLKYIIYDNKENRVGEDNGELCVSGDQMFQGYLNPEDDRKAFLLLDGKRFYKTGDIVKKEGDLIFYIGRRDDQIQIGGYRVEIKEIEGHLINITKKQCAVIPIEKNGVFIYLACFIQSQPTFMKENEILESLKALLPSYMIPQQFIFLEHFPLNNSGKLDKKNLSEHINRL